MSGLMTAGPNFIPTTEVLYGDETDDGDFCDEVMWVLKHQGFFMF